MNQNSLTLWSPDEPHSQEVLQVVEKNVFDLEVLLHPDGAWTAGCHDEARPVQTDTGQPEWREDGGSFREAAGKKLNAVPSCCWTGNMSGYTEIFPVAPGGHSRGLHPRAWISLTKTNTARVERFIQPYL